MFKLASFCIFCALSLSACEQQKQAAAEVGAVPKTILDKAKSDVGKAEALAAEQTKMLESIDAPAEQQP